MLAQKRGKKGRGGRSAALAKKLPSELETEEGRTRYVAAALGKLPAPTPAPPSQRGAVRINEIVAIRFAGDPHGLVAYLRALSLRQGRLNATNEFGWTALMRCARDGLKAHVEMLLAASADPALTSVEDCAENGVLYPAGSTAADICRIRQESLPSTHSTQQNRLAIAHILTNARAIGTERDIAAEQLEARRSLKEAPTYYAVPLLPRPTA